MISNIVEQAGLVLSGFAELHIVDFMWLSSGSTEPWKTVVSQDHQAVDFLKERAAFLFCYDLDELHKMGFPLSEL